MRTLEVLRALNVQNGATVVELSRATGISRPALYRTLETLRDAGYVALDSSGFRYCLTMMVRSLAEGFTDSDSVAQVARPVLVGIQQKLLWPVDLATFRNNAMWLRESTRQASPLTIDRLVVGTRTSMLGAAAGRTYLAFCTHDERELILQSLRQSGEGADAVALIRSRVDEMLDEVRRRGYGERYREPPLDTGAIAVPIRLDGRVLGCICMTFIANVLTPRDAALHHLDDLNRAAERVAEDVRRLEARGTQRQRTAAVI